MQQQSGQPAPPKQRLALFWSKHWRQISLATLLFVVSGTATALLFKNSSAPAATTTKQVAPTTHEPGSSASKQPPARKAETPTNTWKGTVDKTALPLGDGHVSTSPKAGYIDTCTTNFRGGGAMHAGSWLHTTTGTWDSTAKVKVSGNVSWPAARYSATLSGGVRAITTNDLPLKFTTGVFPIMQSDAAYAYDRNPNAIAGQDRNYTLPGTPAAAATPSCTDLGEIGVLTNGVLLFNGLDAAGRDAVAHETQDSCDGHPDGQEMYHYHSITSCILNKATGASTLVGYALDGYGIYVERDKGGSLPTNADLDVCHGRTSQIEWDGKLTTMYHYDATLEYPYTLGCYHGAPVVTKTHR